MTGEFPTFAQFHHDVYGVDPFPWQDALSERVNAADAWPDTVSVPTGLGKTRCIAVAVWHLAKQVHRGMHGRTAPLRVLHVVDRTSIVDQTHADLLTLQEGLRSPDGPATSLIARTLAGAFGSDDTTGPLVIDRIHGSSPDTGQWHAVDRPTVVTMTAHQAVSRGLFRGFGVSPGMSPVHAALVGIDSLVLFDEPHLSAPAVKTLRAIKQHQQHSDVPGIPTGQCVQLGATVDAIGTVHITSDADRSHPVAARRLTAAKTLDVHPCGDKDADVAGELVARTRDALAAVDGMVLVVANTVATARQVYAKLTAGRKPDIPASDALLVTSRIRRHERGALNDRMAAGGARLVVATQTVEAGVDLDAHALVTETSDWSSLVQRLGRLNRRGDRDTAAAQLVAPTTPRTGTVAVYGDDVTEAMTQLAGMLDGHGVGPDQLAALTSEHANLIDQATRPAPPAPTLSAELLPTISHTRPRPAADINVQAYITGVEEHRRITDVTVVWRRILAADVLDDMPVTPDETVSVPVAEVNGLLAARLAGKSARLGALDDDGESSPETSPHKWSSDEPAAYVRRGDEWAPAHSHRDVTPGSLVALHVEAGGHDATGWNPASIDPVEDLSAHIAHDTGRWWIANPEIIAEVAGPLDQERSDAWRYFLYEAPDQIRDDLEQLLDDVLDGRIGPWGEIDYGAITNRGIWVRAMPTKTTEHLVTLVDHAGHVARETREAAIRAGLMPELARVLEHAGHHHDDGKADPAFQAALGAHVRGPTLAKLAPGTRYRRGLVPTGWRHEAASVALLPNDTHPLTTHIVVAHHGWARPVMPPAEGPGQNIDTADRFAALNQRYGPWGLAWLETVMRLADHRASAAPVVGCPPPVTRLPREPSTERTDQPAIELSGLDVDGPLAWWAAAGALAAATDLDRTARISFTSGSGSRARLHTSATLKQIADHVVAMRSELDDVRSDITPKYEKVNTDRARELVSAYAGPARRAIASLIDDTTAGDNKNHVLVRAHWSHQNSGFLRGFTSDSDHVADVLTGNTASQYDTDKTFGLVGYRGTSAILAGTGITIRSGLLPLVLAAHTRLPSTGSNRPAGVTSDNHAALPMPERPTTWTTLVALLQSAASAPRQPWHTAGIHTLQLQRMTPDEGKVPTWEVAL